RRRLPARRSRGRGARVGLEAVVTTRRTSRRPVISVEQCPACGGDVAIRQQRPGERYCVSCQAAGRRDRKKERIRAHAERAAAEAQKPQVCSLCKGSRRDPDTGAPCLFCGTSEEWQEWHEGKRGLKPNFSGGDAVARPLRGASMK